MPLLLQTLQVGISSGLGHFVPSSEMQWESLSDAFLIILTGHKPLPFNLLLRDRQKIGTEAARDLLEPRDLTLAF